MQNADRRIFSLLFVALPGLLCACYAHPGQAHDDDPALWEQHAIDACERGDERAYRAFVERGDLDEDTIRCSEPDIDQDNTSASSD